MLSGLRKSLTSVQDLQDNSIQGKDMPAEHCGWCHLTCNLTHETCQKLRRWHRIGKQSALKYPSMVQRPGHDPSPLTWRARAVEPRAGELTAGANRCPNCCACCIVCGTPIRAGSCCGVISKLTFQTGQKSCTNLTFDLGQCQMLHKVRHSVRFQLQSRPTQVVDLVDYKPG